MSKKNKKKSPQSPAPITGRTAEIRVWVRSGAVRLNIVGAEREINYLLDGDVLTLWYGSDMNFGNRGIARASTMNTNMEATNAAV